MYNNNTEYSVRKIRDQYIKKESTDLDRLKKLDRKVKAPANCFAYIFGSISALVMGFGMSLVMTDIGVFLGAAETMIPGIVIGVIGMLLAALNYPIYKAILGARRRRYAGEIIALSGKIMNK